MSQHKKLYDQERDTDGYENTVMKHMLAMTAEGLHSKAAIAVELAYRDHELQKLKAAPDAESTIWTHFSALAIQNPWTAMFIKPGENPIDKIAMFGELAGQKYGATRMEAIAELLGESLRIEQALEVESEPVYQYERYCGSIRSNWIDCDKASYEAFAKSPDDYRTRILYTHSPTLPADVIERIKALPSPADVSQIFLEGYDLMKQHAIRIVEGEK